MAVKTLKLRQIVSVDIAQRRSSAALKAWETRRRQGWQPHRSGASARSQDKSRKNRLDEAIAEFERESTAQQPDWHRIALRLRAAIMAPIVPAVIDQTGKTIPSGELARIETRWADYPVGRISAFKILNPTIVVTFADGEVVKCPAVSIEGRPLNIGRGLRVAVAFYQARIARRAGLRNRPGFWRAVPEIVSCVVDETGETFDACECTIRTEKSREAQDWRLRRQKQ